ncbi:hypothetical protein GCM10009000_050410 [Halobacterium noricense]
MVFDFGLRRVKDDWRRGVGVWLPEAGGFRPVCPRDEAHSPDMPTDDEKSVVYRHSLLFASHL